MVFYPPQKKKKKVGSTNDFKLEILVEPAHIFSYKTHVYNKQCSYIIASHASMAEEMGKSFSPKG